MLAIRSTPRVAAIVAAVAGACLMLGGCGGGSIGGSAATGSSGGASAPAGSSSSSSSSSSPAPVSTASVAKGLLTGHFCTDFTHLGTTLGKLTPAQSKNIEQNRGEAVAFLQQAAADFNGLANEAPGKVGPFMHTLAAEYQTLASAAGSGASLSQLKNEAKDVDSVGKSGAAFRQLIQYLVTACH
jgi:hypothetical protein